MVLRIVSWLRPCAVVWSISYMTAQRSGLKSVVFCSPRGSGLWLDCWLVFLCGEVTLVVCEGGCL